MQDNKAYKTESNCPFCRGNNLLKTDILGETKNGYLIENSKSKGNYLIIPNAHVENMESLPNEWWTDLKTLIGQIPLQLSDYNLSLNYGEHAGQTLKHLHFWVIPRSISESSSGKGLASLIREYNLISK